MKLINHTLLFLSAILFTTVGLWAILFYSQLMRQVKSSIDGGLENTKILIIDKLKDDSLLKDEHNFSNNNYIIKQVNEKYALQVKDTYKDTLIYSEFKQHTYDVRLLTTAFVSADGKYYEMKVISHEFDKGELIRKIVISLLWLFLFLFISTLLVNNFVLKKTWQPFYKLLEHLHHFQLDKSVNRELPKTNIAEFSLLNKSIKKLLSSNVDIFNSQKQFIENASHELQTPLAIGINKLELLAGSENLAPEQTNKIGEIIEVFQRLSGLNKSLLLLSKIENNQFIAEELLDLDKIFTKLIQDFTDYSAFQKIEIIYQKEDNWLLTMNRDLCVMMILNLVKNAIIHNQPGGEINIWLRASSLTIENTSTEPGIPPDKLFTRFSKTPGSKNSTGLGLAIVKVIADISGLTIEYTYNGRHNFKVFAGKM